MDSTLRQILYFSSASFPMGDDDLRELLRESRNNNKQHHVTGVLFYVDKVFLQIIEGPDLPIGRLLENIRRDERNEGLVKTLDRSIERRAFPDWSMGFRSSKPVDNDLKTSFHNLQRREDFDSIERIDEMVFSLIKDMYLSNAGRSF